jgi:hypothetical protein
VATWEDVRAAVAALPGTDEPRPRSWKAHGRPLAWERPLRDRDREELGDAAWPGEVLGVRTASPDAKDELVRSAPEVYFTTSHFDGYPAVLVRLEKIDPEELAELLVDAWLTQVPRTVARAWLDQHPEVPQ